MAIIDYGVIAKKNKKIINNTLFTDMYTTIGTCIAKDTDGYGIDGNYFLFLGDIDFYIGVYKTSIAFFTNNKRLDYIIDIPNSSYTKGLKYSYCKVVNDIKFNIKRIDDFNRYYCCFTYKGDFYEFIYGYGVDTDINYWYCKNNKAINKVKRFYRNTL